MIRTATADDFATVMRLYRQLNPAPYAVIENVVVEKERRGTGVGKQAMSGTLQIAWDAGCYKAMLMTGSKRPSTLGFYRASGFSQESKTAFLARPPS